MKPTIGRQVIYTPTAEEKKEIVNGGGNSADKLPATVVAVWSDSEEPAVNLKVTTDGPGADLWKTSASKGDGEGQWNWPVIAK
jgi:hypothetical protein